MKMGKGTFVEKPVKIEPRDDENVETQIKPYNPITNPSGIVENIPVPVQVVEKRAIVDTQYVSTKNLIVHTEGDGWKIDLFLRVAGQDDKPVPLQLGMSAVEQHYKVIYGYELLVDSPIDQQQDSQTKEFTVTGEGSSVYGVIVNTGDMFRADIGNGEVGIFAVETSVRMSYTKDAAYKITYRLIAKGGSEWEDNLNEKISSEFYFEPSQLERDDSPIMTKDAKIVYVSLTEHEHRLESMFKDMFWSREVNGFCPPGQTYSIYDAFHSAFLRRIGLVDRRRPAPFYLLGRLDLEDANSLWELFNDMDHYKFYNLNRRFGIMSTKMTPGQHVERTVRWSPYSEIVHPLEGSYFDIDNEVQSGIFPVAKTTWEEAIPEGYVPQTLSERLSAENSLVGRPLYYTVSLDPYILSTAFYDQDASGMSVLEVMLYRAVHGETIPADIIAELFEGIYKEPRLSQFYYIPMLLVLKEYLTYGTQR